ncbi:MAG: hypothetical protein Q9179_003359 [Wetmoreana sp. 5 TL-2023]
MSGAEALAAVGLASNIIQFVDFTTELCVRISDYTTASSGLPKELAQRATQLGELLNTLKELSQLSDEQVSAKGIIAQCEIQAQELAGLFESLRADAGKGRWSTAKAAFKSMRRTQQIDKVDRLIHILGLQLQVEVKRAAQTTETDISTVLELQSEQLDLLQTLHHATDTRNTTPSLARGPESEPVWIVPLSRNPRFVGREDIFDKLKAHLEGVDGSMPVAALYGLGGVGKTQIALEHIFRTRSPTTAVFWVHASSTSRFAESYKRIASECKIPGHDDPNSNTLQLVRCWLEIHYTLDWLMVIDNVDDRTIFLERPNDMTISKALIEYIPRTARGKIIYTTRSRDIGIDLVSGDEPIRLLPLSREEGISMLGKKIIQNSSDEDQITLLEELAYLPLAISQAVAFMAKRRKTVPDYIRLLQDRSTRSRVLDHRALHHGREDRPSESVASTWWVTFQHVQGENPRSAELLAIMSLFDRQRIPLVMIQDSAEDNFEFEEAIGILEAFSLINTYSCSEGCDQLAVEALCECTAALGHTVPVLCDIHRLVQNATRELLERPENNRSSIADKALLSVSRVFPSGFYGTWPLCRLLYPHATAVLQYYFHDTSLTEGPYLTQKIYELRGFALSPEQYGRLCNHRPLVAECQKACSSASRETDRESLLHCSSLLHNLAKYCRQQGDLKQSEEYILAALTIRCDLLECGSREIFETQESHLTTIVLLQGHGDTRELHRKIINKITKQLEPDNRRTLVALNQLDYGLRALGAYEEGEKQRRQELSAKRELFNQAPKDLVLAESLIDARSRLAQVLIDQGNYAEAQKLLEDAIKLSQNVHGQEHPLVWYNLELLAIIKGLGESYDEAHNLLAHVISQRKELYGEMHFSTLIARGYYLSLLTQEGYYPEAELEAKSLGKDELFTRRHESNATVCNQGISLLLQRKYAEAETSFKRLIELCPEPGPYTKYSHVAAIIDESTSQELLRICLDAQGKTDEARSYRYSPPPSPISEDQFEDARKLHQKSRDLCENGNFDGAEATAREELTLRMQYAGLDDVHTQTCLYLLARCLYMQKRYNDSQSLFRQVLVYSERVHGWQDPRTQDALSAMAATNRKQGRLEEAEECYRRQLCWVENTAGKLDVSTFKARSDLALILCDQRKHSEAEELDRLNLAIQFGSAGGSQSQGIAQAYTNLAWLLGCQGQMEESEQCFHRAYSCQVELYGNSDARSIELSCDLAGLLAAAGRCQNADELYLLLGMTLALPQSEDGDGDPAAVANQG